MIYKTLINLSFVSSLFLVLGLTAITQASEDMATINDNVQYTSTEVEQSSRSPWVWKNDFTSQKGAIASRFLANSDTIGGKSCIIADNFKIGQDSTWVLDTLRAYMYHTGRPPDSIQIIIWPDFFGPNDDSVLLDITFPAIMPVGLQLYPLNFSVKSQNIVLGAGTYWITFLAVYTAYDYFAAPIKHYCLWNRLDTLMGPGQMVCKDSIGAHYPTYPTNGWQNIWFTGENQFCSARFWISADAQPSAIQSGFQKPRTLLSVYPNPASEHILFQLNNTNVSEVEIYDVMGKLMKTVSAKSEKVKVDTRLFTNGIYFYNVINKKGEMVDRGRFSVSR